MFANLKGLFNPSNKDLRKRILFTLMCLAIFALGTNIIIPGAKSITNNIGFLELLSLVSGGNLKTFSIFSLGVIPYINASIIIQLLQMDIIPYLSDLRKEGHTGRQKLNIFRGDVSNILVLFAREAQAGQECLHSYSAPPANLRSSQRVLLIVARLYKKFTCL